MKTIIAGSRDFDDYSKVCEIIKASGFNISVVVSGVCRGVDYCGCLYATENKIPLKLFPADWDTHGLSAAPIRNEKMAIYSDAAIIIIKNYSRGSMNMLSQMNKYKKRYYVVFINETGNKPVTIIDSETEKNHELNKIPIGGSYQSDSETDSGLIRFFEPTN